jgi:hypothetical protein
LRALKRTWAQKPLKNLTYPNQKWQATFENPKKGGRGRVNRNVFEQNTKKNSLHPKPSIKNMKIRNRNQMGWAHDLNVLNRTRKINQNPRGKLEGAQVEDLQG